MSSEHQDEVRKVWQAASRVTIHVVALTAASVVFAHLSGRLGFDRPLDMAKCLTATAAVMAGWGTYFLLHPPSETWKQSSPAELLHQKLFRITFAPGMALGVLGAMW